MRGMRRQRWKRHGLCAPHRQQRAAVADGEVALLLAGANAGWRLAADLLKCPC